MADGYNIFDIYVQAKSKFGNIEPANGSLPISLGPCVQIPFVWKGKSVTITLDRFKSYTCPKKTIVYINGDLYLAAQFDRPATLTAELLAINSVATRIVSAIDPANDHLIIGDCCVYCNDFTMTLQQFMAFAFSN